jgi:hypothetical protein
MQSVEGIIYHFAFRHSQLDLHEYSHPEHEYHRLNPNLVEANNHTIACSMFNHVTRKMCKEVEPDDFPPTVCILLVPDLTSQALSNNSQCVSDLLESNIYLLQVADSLDTTPTTSYAWPFGNKISLITPASS